MPIIQLFTVTPQEGDVLININCDEFSKLATQYSTFIENNKWLHTNMVNCQVIDNLNINSPYVCTNKNELNNLHLNLTIFENLSSYLESSPNNFLIFQLGDNFNDIMDFS